MINPRNLRALVFGSLAIVASGAGVYMVKSIVKDRDEKLEVIMTQIEEEQDRITVLEADWSYLTRPSRIQHLSREMLDFAPVEPERILTLNTLDGDPLDGDPFNGDSRSSDEGLLEIKTIKGIE